MPRRCTAAPKLFGEYFDIPWNGDEGNDDAKDRLAAAKIQHAYACVIREKIKASEYKTQKDYAVACGVSSTRLGKVLRGELLIRIEDLVQVERLLKGVHRDALKLMSTPDRRM